MFACYCLNILIETGGNDSALVTSETLHLDDEEKGDSFFQQDIQQVGKLINITKVHSFLVQTRSVGHWIINCCINCASEAYAVHKEKGASCVLIYSKLRDTLSIEAVKADLSKVFNIIMKPSDISKDGNVLSAYRYCDTEAITRNITQVMSDFLKKETLAVDERIEKYAAEQYEILNNLKDIAYEEHSSLTRLVQNLSDQQKPASTKKSMAATVMESSPSFRLNDQTYFTSAEKPIKSTRHTPKRQKSSPAAPISSYDAEGLFEFEGSDDINSVASSEVDESDREDKEEGISIPKNRPSRGSIAKSLPMNIPAFMSQARNNSSEDLDDFPQEDNLDIAASIKALARSVHGDAVFGELPRPRFSTQI